MKKLRNIIQIDEELCTGCGQCIIGCAEGALQLIDGKAKLVGEVYCDGLGACIGECPEGALTIVKREADDFDEQAVEDLLARQKQAAPPIQPSFEAPLACGCPSSQDLILEAAAATGTGPAMESTLGHWPIKLGLLGPNAPFLQGANLLLLADCAAASIPNLHAEYISGRAIALACPKLDNMEAHIERLAGILDGARPASLTVVHMEVPCCMGLDFMAKQAMAKAGLEIPLGRIQVSREGKVLERVNVPWGQAA